MESTVTVYQFEIYDAARHRWLLQDKCGTMDAITRKGGVAIRSTALVVLASRLDEEGFLEISRRIEN